MNWVKTAEADIPIGEIVLALFPPAVFQFPALCVKMEDKFVLYPSKENFTVQPVWICRIPPVPNPIYYDIPDPIHYEVDRV